MGWGTGRAWPLLTGERGHYEMAAGRQVWPLISAMEHFASPTGLLPEQIWDEPDRPEIHMYFGKPTGAAMPLMWAHSEYVRLLRTARDGQVFDLIPAVADRYLKQKRSTPGYEMWKASRQIRKIPVGRRLRILAKSQFTLRWSTDSWLTPNETASTPTPLGIHYADVPTPRQKQSEIVFTFQWHHGLRWEGRDYTVAVT